MLIDLNTMAAETRAIECLQDSYIEHSAPERVSQERRTFDLPKSIWWVMFLAYAVFFTAITVATGNDRSTLFVLVISIGYTVMYFGTAAALNSVGSNERPATIQGDIETATGKLRYHAAFAQILTVPILLAFFGCAIAVISAVVRP